MKNILIALTLVLAGCVSSIPEDNPATMIPFVRPACPCKYAPPMRPKDTPGGPVSKAIVRRGWHCRWNAQGVDVCQDYTPIQFFPPHQSKG